MSFALHALILTALAFFSGNQANGRGRYGLAQDGTFSLTWIPGSEGTRGHKGDFDTVIEGEETETTGEPAVNFSNSATPLEKLIEVTSTDPRSVFNTDPRESLIIQATKTTESAAAEITRPIHESTEVASFSPQTPRTSEVEISNSTSAQTEASAASSQKSSRGRMGDPRNPDSDQDKGSDRGGLGPGSGRIGFFGIFARARRVVYVIDASESMRKHHAMELAREELLRSLKRLESSAFFQVLFFDLKPHAMPNPNAREKLFQANSGNLRKAESFIKLIQPDAGTDRFLAISEALQLKPDVIFLLTDADEPEMNAKELWEIRRANKQGAAIHVVEFGLGADLREDSFLKKLTSQNRGTHHYHDLTKSEP